MTILDTSRAAAPADRANTVSPLPIALIAVVSGALAIAAIYQQWFYLMLPVDLLSFAESPFITDIIKFREGAPLYLAAGDNNSYPYSPGAPVLTYLIAELFGQGTSIPALRLVQFSYVILASLVAVTATAGLAEIIHGRNGLNHRGWWIASWWPLLFLVCLDPRFNPYVHSLHNDGLALLISMIAFWLIVAHSRSSRTWHVVAMTLLPAVGFLVKQNQIMWLGLFAVYLLLDGRAGWRRVAVVAATGAVAALVVVAAEFALWGEPFRYWTFSALGDKQVSILRSILHFLHAGGYAAMGLFAALVILRRDRPRALFALWVVWALLFGLQAYTSGIGFATNHLGSGVVIATAWLLACVPSIWPRPDTAPRWERYVRQLAAAGAVVLIFGGFNLIREPRNRVPADVQRFIAEIEHEFAGMDPNSVLLDNGSWIYLRHGVLMRDRSAPVSLHVGINQPEINRAALAETLERFNQRYYARILARELDTPRSDYDFQNRGSGVKEAIFANYDVVRRIRGVNVNPWWPAQLMGEILVLEPKQRL